VAYAKALVVTPTIGSFVVCAVLVSAGMVFLRERDRDGEVREAAVARRAEATMPSESKPAVHESEPIKVADNPPMPQSARHEWGTQRVVLASERVVPQAVKAGTFEHAKLSEIAMLQPVQRFDGMTAQEAMRHISVHGMIDGVVPYAPFHYGVDAPLPQLMVKMFGNSQVPVRVREGRYVVIEQTSPAPALNPRIPALNDTGRSLLWVDVQTGIGVGAFFFQPTNGEPTPTLTLFSKQVRGGSIRVQQLPAEFVRELKEWETAAGIPAVTARYFINSEGVRTVLAHDEDFCAVVTSARDACKKKNQDAADMDGAARIFLGRVHYASNATGREAMRATMQ